MLCGCFDGVALLAIAIEFDQLAASVVRLSRLPLLIALVLAQLVPLPLSAPPVLVRALPVVLSSSVGGQCGGTRVSSTLTRPSTLHSVHAPVTLGHLTLLLRLQLSQLCQLALQPLLLSLLLVDQLQCTLRLSVFTTAAHHTAAPATGRPHGWWRRVELVDHLAHTEPPHLTDERVHIFHTIELSVSQYDVYEAACGALHYGQVQYLFHAGSVAGVDVQHDTHQLFQLRTERACQLRPVSTYNLRRQRINTVRVERVTHHTHLVQHTAQRPTHRSYGCTVDS